MRIKSLVDVFYIGREDGNKRTRDMFHLKFTVEKSSIIEEVCMGGFVSYILGLLGNIHKNTRDYYIFSCYSQQITV